MLAASMARDSSTFIAIRASTSTCLPAASALRVIGQCRYGHVPITTASSSGSATRSAQRAYVLGMLNSRAAASVDSRRRLHTAAISTPSHALSPGTCRERQLPPSPIMPTRIRSLAMGVLVTCCVAPSRSHMAWFADEWDLRVDATQRLLILNSRKHELGANRVVM